MSSETLDKIESKEVAFNKLTVDSCGALFTWRNRLFRAINHESVETIKDMFQCGMMDELMDKRLFVRSWITDYVLDGYGLVIEHQRISPVVYPYEWSFSMLKDAAIAVLKLNAIARKYCYQTKDCHGYNICFDCTDPLFVDLGSFEKIDRQYRGWIAYEEFLRFYYYPLRIWSRGNHYFARRALFGCGLNDMMTHLAYYLYRSPFFRLLNYRFLDYFFFFWVKAITVSLNPAIILSIVKKIDIRALKFREMTTLGAITQAVKASDLWLLQSVSFEALIRKVNRVSAGKLKTTWGDYQAGCFDSGDRLKSSARFERILTILKSLEITTVMELAGNQGFFSHLMLERLGIEQVICTDYDERAVDVCYLTARKGARLVPVVLDFTFPMTNYINNQPPFERYKANAVIALAVTHHLVLGQGLALDYIFGNMKMYASKYVLTEFMPMGLYNGKYAPELPPWYTFDWFKEAFEKHFKTILVEKLEANRILFVGELRS